MYQNRATCSKGRPELVRRGSTVVKIYRTPTKGYEGFTVVYHTNGQRKRESFADHGIARQRAAEVAESLNTGQLEVLKLTNKDRLVYQRALSLLAPIKTPLDVAASHFVEAVKILGADLVIEAARHYARQNLVKVVPKLVPEVVEELLAAKRADGCSERYVADLESRLGRFGKDFSTYIGSLAGHEIDDWLRNLKLSGRSRNNYRGALLTLMTFAVGRRYLPKGWSELDSVAVAKDRGGQIEIFSGEEMSRLLSVADDRLIPFLTLGAFAGLRHAEIERLEWSDVRLTEGHVVVMASKAKTAQRRIVPILPNLAAWLAKFAQKQGPVCPLANITNALVRLCGNTATKHLPAVKWKHNALRHSFISYRVADIQNVPQVALEAGNSPQIIFNNYRELVTAAEAKHWFSITPKSAANVILLQQAAG